jgi:carbonic anhydrase
MTPAARTTAGLALLAGLAAALPAQRSPDEALRLLQEGNRRFAAGKPAVPALDEGARRTLARGQSPLAVVLCCADSRAAPEHVFNAGLGELFVVRVAGHVCDEETLASVEYAVERLNAPLCVVLGHEDCDAVAAALAQIAARDPTRAGANQATRALLERIEPAARKARARDFGGRELAGAAEEEHVQQTVQECLRRSPLLRRHAAAGRCRVVGARYHLHSGEVEWLPPRPLPEADPEAAPLARGAAPVGVPPQVALRMLQAGHRRYLGAGLPAGDVSAARRESLTHGEQPFAIVLTCADSRVAPEHVFDAGLGELCVIRTAGGVLNDDVLASIEHAAARTGASLLVAMGHTRCDAIAAAAANPEHQHLATNLRALLSRLEPSVEKSRARGASGDALVDLAARANVLRLLAEARTRSAVVRQLEREGRLALLPAIYDTTAGDLTWLDEEPAGHVETHAAPGGETTAPRAAPDDLRVIDLPLWTTLEPAATEPRPATDRPGPQPAPRSGTPRAAPDLPFVGLPMPPVDPLTAPEGSAKAAADPIGPPAAPAGTPIDAVAILACTGLVALMVAMLVALASRRVAAAAAADAPLEAAVDTAADTAAEGAGAEVIVEAEIEGEGGGERTGS